MYSDQRIPDAFLTILVLLLSPADLMRQAEHSVLLFLLSPYIISLPRRHQPDSGIGLCNSELLLHFVECIPDAKTKRCYRRH